MNPLACSRRIVLCALAFLALPLTGIGSGLPDAGFGPNGDSRAVIGSGATSQMSTLVLPSSGRIIHAMRRASGDIAIGALTRNGVNDTSFNGGSPLVLVAAGSGSMYLPRLSLQVTGSLILLAATESSGSFNRPVICQIRSDGSFDPAFTSGQYPGQSGCIRLDVPASAAPNGVVLAGVTPAETGTILRFAGTGYNFGAPTNLTFPITGLLLVGTSENPSSAFLRETSAHANVTVNAISLYRLPQGGMNLFFAGSNNAGGDSNLYVGKRHIGVSSSSFTDASYSVNLTPNGFDTAQAITIDDAGRPLLGTIVDTGNGLSTCMLQRLTETLGVDGSFGPSGTNGRKFLHFGASSLDSARCDGVVTSGSGSSYRVTAAGSAVFGGNREMTVARLLSDGSPDFGFGVDGATRIRNAPPSSPPWRDMALALALQGDSPIVAGISEPMTGATPPDSTMVVVRLTGDRIFANGFD